MGTGKRSGTFLFLALAILFCIVLISANFFDYMMKQKRLSHRIGEHRMMSKLAYSLATLAAHKLNISPRLLRNESSATAFPDISGNFKELFDNLALPLDQMKDIEGKIELKDPSSFDMDFAADPVLENILEKGNVDPQITFNCKQDDFVQTGCSEKGYPREKKGFIRLRILIHYSRGSKYSIEEEFRFAVRVKVTAMLVPVLSKFTLYVENGGVSGKPLFVGYNQVSVDADGNLSSTRAKAKPMVLNNDDDQSLPVTNKFTEFVEAQRGLVYLGGPGTFLMNPARTDAGNLHSNSGEGFHSFRDQSGWGWMPRYMVQKNGEDVISLEMEQGASDDPNTRASGWYDKALGNSAWGRHLITSFNLRMSSIFRLMGVQNKPSPTLVLGNVMSHFLMIRGYTTIPEPSSNDKVYKLWSYTYGPPEQPEPFFQNVVFEPPLAKLADAFALGNTPADWELYTFKYGSWIASRSMNLALAYMYDPGNPFAYKSFGAEDTFSKYMKASPEEKFRHAIPDSFKKAAPDGADLKDMKKFVDVLLQGNRVTYEIPNNPTDTSVWKALESRGLVSDGRLALNGWVAVKQPLKLELPARPLKYLSNCGFIAYDNDIVIQRDIEPSESPPRQNCIMYLVALNGDIIFNTPSDAKVQVACMAFGNGTTGGRIIFKGGRPKIRGALAMQKIFKDESELSEYMGPFLTYYRNLAAIPNSSVEKTSEKSLLAYNFEELPILVQ